MKYFAIITGSFVTKNKAHEEIQQFIQSHNSILLKNMDKKEAFIEKLKNEVKEINANHKRSNDILLEIWIPPYEKERTNITVNGNFHMIIYPVYQEI